jgi:PAS domain S-box-containing protein
MSPLFDAVDFGLLLVDGQGQLTCANRWVRERSPAGSPRCGEPLAQAFDGAIEARLSQAARSCVEFGNATRLSQAFHPSPLPLFAPGHVDRPDQARLRQAVDLTPVLLEPSGPRSCLIQVRDMSEAVRRELLLQTQSANLAQELRRLTAAQLEIERQSLRFAEIARLAPVGLFETDVAGRVTYSNARAAELLGVAMAEFHARSWFELLARRGVPVAQLHEHWQAAGSTGVRHADEFCLLQTGRNPVWLRAESNPTRDAAGALQGYIVTLVDVTALHESARDSGSVPPTMRSLGWPTGSSLTADCANWPFPARRISPTGCRCCSSTWTASRP